MKRGRPQRSIPGRMYDTLRGKLRDISYYSASRRVNKWQRIFELAPLFALVPALAGAWLLDAMFAETREIARVRGVLVQRSGVSAGSSTPEAMILAKSLEGFPAEPGLVGDFTLSVEETRRGWPAVTTIITTPVLVSVNEFAVMDDGEPVALDPSQPTHAAIARALDASPRKDEVVTAAGAGATPRVDRLGWNWLAAVLALGAALTIVIAALLRIFWFGAMYHGAHRKAKRWQMRRENKCIGCGYDLRGLEWSERCPECGTLVE